MSWSHNWKKGSSTSAVLCLTQLALKHLDLDLSFFTMLT